MLLLACSEPAPDLAVGEVFVQGGKIIAPSGEPKLRLTADRVTAGFVDAHAHLDGLGAARASLDLVGAASYAETLDRVASAPAGDGWLTGRGWDQNDWPDAPAGAWPLAADLDARVGARPVVLRRVDGHASWLSSAALSAAGISRETPDPAGGRIVRDESGAPSGVLVDNAADLVKLPPPTDAERRSRLRRAVDDIAAVGLTGVHDMGCDDATLAILEEWDRDGTLPIRVWVYLNPDSGAAKKLLATGPWRGNRVSVVGIKAYADGALGSRGALLSAPYADAPELSGLAVTSSDALRDLAERTLGAGAQLAIHAIGDRGVTNALDAFAAARAKHPDRTNVRLRVEHAQVVRPEDVARFRELGVIASMQPTHAISDAPWAGARLGPERIAWAYAWRTLLDAGAPLAFGSDFPVEAIDPALGMAAATTKLSVDEAVAGFTSGAASAVGESHLGSLEVGNTADLTAWEIEGERWRAVATVVGGKVVWRRGKTL